MSEWRKLSLEDKIRFEPVKRQVPTGPDVEQTILAERQAHRDWLEEKGEQLELRAIAGNPGDKMVNDRWLLMLAEEKRRLAKGE